jgi:peptide/nickel transport system permease protein
MIRTKAKFILRRGRKSSISQRIGASLFTTFVILLLTVILFPGFFAPYDPLELDVINRLQAPSKAHLFGTDEGGRDIFSRVLYGAKESVGASIIIVLMASGLGTILGAIAGWFGGKIDFYLMRIVDVFLSFPYLVLAMALAASLGRDMRSAILALILVWWPSYARMVRGQVLSIKERLFIRAARTVGANNFQILFWHIIPHTYRTVGVRASMDVGYVLISLTGLSFLGLGAQNPSPEWGLMISNARSYVLASWWYSVFPGIAILVVVSLFIYAADRFSGAER